MKRTPHEKTWDRKITSERQALRETARIWRYIARIGGQKPDTTWLADCPLCEFFDCETCERFNFWGVSLRGSLETPLCLESLTSPFHKWNWSNNANVRRYHALRIRWAALRALNDHFSS